MEKPVYLDYDTSTPLDPEVIGAIRPYIEEHFGNPACSHWFGVQTRAAVENARSQVAALLNCLPSEIVFTSGVTESNNHAVKGIAFALREKGSHIITTQIEHPSVREVCKFLEGRGFSVTYLPVDEYGLVDAEDVEKAVTGSTILITVMHVNNQVGTIQPIEKISKIARGKGIILHTDAAQSAGKIPLDVDSLGVGLLSMSGHKIYAPKGVGALYIRSGLYPEKLIHGTRHEQDRRAGTENVSGIVGLGKACEIAGKNMKENMSRLKEMRDLLYNELKRQFREIRLNGHLEKRLPDTLNVSFKGLDVDTLFSRIKDGVAVTPDSSYVLKAMNVPEEWAKCTIRFSVGKFTTGDEIMEAVSIIRKTCPELL